MKRRNAERDLSEELGTSKSQRIVRRKVRTSPSPEEPRKRDLRSSALYDKYTDDKYAAVKGDKYEVQEKYGDKPYDKYEGGGGRDKYHSHSHAGSEERRLGGKGDVGDKYLDKARPGHYSRSDSDHQGHAHSAGGGGNNRFKDMHIPPRFEYALRLGNLDFKIQDGELKTTLFREFKRYGYINVKVIGYGRERHAFINFTNEEDARRARRDKPEVSVQDRTLPVEWSKSTLSKYPHLSTSSMNPSPSGMGKKHDSFAQDDGFENYTPSRERDRRERYSSGTPGGSSSKTTRDVSYRSSSSSRHSTSHHHSPHHTSAGGTPTHHEGKHVVPVIDPNATRTLFVGNLEQDITERELRDLFGPYGRIESVDIKLQRSTGTAYAFVKFVTINDAINAKNDMHGRQYGMFRLKIGFGRGSPSAKVWIGNITDSSDVSEIRGELDRFGLIRRIDYATGENHAFVHFDSLDAAQAAVSSLAGYRFHTTGRQIKIDMSRPAHMRTEFDDFDPDLYQSGPSKGSSSFEKKSYSRVSSSTDLDGSYRRKVRDHSSPHYSANGNHGDELSYVSKSGSARIVSESDGGGRSHSYEHGDRERDRARDRNGVRKRPYSPSGEHFNTGYRRHSSRGGDMDNDVMYRSKRPCNGMDRNSRHMRRVTSHEGEGGKTQPSNPEPMDTSEKRERGRGSHKDRSRSNMDKTSSSTNKRTQEDESKKTVLPLESAPADPLSTDTALKLEDSSAGISPDSSSKSAKPDSTNPENLADMAKMYPVAWRGNLVLKNTGFPTRMHLIGGDPAVAETLLHSRDGKGDLTELRITQRLRLEPPRLEEVNKRMSSAGPSGHCILLALPGPTPSQSSPDNRPSDETMQLRPLRSLVSYLKQKEAAGIVALNAMDGTEGSSDRDMAKDVIGVLHAFPPCEFSQSQLLKIGPNLGNEPSKEDHIVVLLVKGTV